MFHSSETGEDEKKNKKKKKSKTKEQKKEERNCKKKVERYIHLNFLKQVMFITHKCVHIQTFVVNEEEGNKRKHKLKREIEKIFFFFLIIAHARTQRRRKKLATQT